MTGSIKQTFALFTPPWKETLETLQDGLRSLERHFREALVQDEGTPLRAERRQREQRAYSLWKGIPHALAQAKGEALPDDYGVVAGCRRESGR